jgi:hypothetical protein
MTIAHLPFTTSSRWGELGPSRAVELTATAPTAPHKTERTEAEREAGPRRSPLFGAIVGAIEDWVAQTPPPVSADTTATDTAPEADTGSDSDALAQAMTEFARALMHALREGRGPHGEGRGLHLGHAYGRQGWGDAAQRMEQLAQQFAPAPPTQPVEPPADMASAPLPVEPSGDAATIEAPAPTEVEIDAAPPVTPADTATTPSLHVTIDLGLPESPWKAVHDGLIESFAELQRAIGGPDTERDDKSLEEQLSDMLVALAVKLQTSELNIAALAPPGSLLSVVA